MIKKKPLPPPLIVVLVVFIVLIHLFLLFHYLLSLQIWTTKVGSEREREWERENKKHMSKYSTIVYQVRKNFSDRNSQCQFATADH